MTVEERRKDLEETKLDREQLYNELQKKLTDQAKGKLRDQMMKDVDSAYQEWQRALQAYNEFVSSVNKEGWSSDQELPVTFRAQ
ncbi:MAG TPA: hypothetical protein VL947_03050 [Cytophagales bacterium]|nr:hypothetical protein [Cytophagales bacterium]